MPTPIRHYKIIGNILEVYLRTANLSDLNDVEWKGIEFDIKNHIAVLLHGFPGDNPVGLLFYLVNDIPVFIATLGEHSDIYETKYSNIAEFVHEWYVD